MTFGELYNISLTMQPCIVIFKKDKTMFISDEQRKILITEPLDLFNTYTQRIAIVCQVTKNEIKWQA